MSKTTIPTGGITADAINGTLIADDAINSEHYTDGSIDTAHIGDSQVTAAKTSGVGGTTVQLARAEGTSAVSEIALDHFSDTYDFYRFIGWFNCSSTGQEWIMRFRDGGSDITSAYYCAVGQAGEVYSSGSQHLGTTMEDWNQTHIRLANNTNSNNQIPFRLDCLFYDFNARDAGNSAGIQYQVTNFRNDNKLRTMQGSAGYFNQGSGDSYEGFKLYPGSGNIQYYSYVLYGFKKS